MLILFYIKERLVLINTNNYQHFIAMVLSFVYLILQSFFSCAYGQKINTLLIEHPNVILILADDMGIGDISAFNDGLTTTHTLDSLVNQSIYFNQAYSGSPVCAPSRAALLTGRYPFRTGVVTLSPVRYPKLTSLKLEETTIADMFKKNGYATGMVGKWHLGMAKEYRPLNRGFDESVEFIGAQDVPDSYFNYRLDVQGTYKSFTNDYLTKNLTLRAMDFVRRHKNNPFFLHLAYHAPHRPLSAPKDKIDKYLNKGFNKNTATIYAMIEIMDNEIGRLLTELDRLNIRKKTIIIFASDNGPDPLTGERFNMDLRGSKYTVYEGGIRVPFLINWDGVLKPNKRDEVVHFTDVVPTLIEMCHLSVSSSINLDGASLAGLLFNNGEKTNLPNQRFWQWNRGVPYYSQNAAEREGNWKLVLPYVTRGVPDKKSYPRPVLFNLENDPQEQHDVSKKYPVRYDRMRVLLREWSREMEYSRLKGYE